MKDLLITGAYPVQLNGQTPAEIVYMPAGKSTIRANVNGKPKEITVNVTPATASVLQASLGRLLTDTVQPFIDFNHKEDDSAATPTGFKWSPDGVMLELDWTSAGKTAVEGKTYRYFSPTFLLSEAGEPSALPDTGPVGALTNNPAFRRMKRITAAEAALTGVDEPPNTKETQMAEQANETVTAALRTELDTLRAENKTLKESIETQRVEAINTQADLLIEAAVRDHKIAPKDEKIRAGLKKLYMVDAEAAKAAIESLPTNPAFNTVVQVSGSHREVGKPPGASRADELKSIVKKIQASHPGMTWDNAWSIGESDHPELFGKTVVRS